jgi:glutamine synthetase
MLGRLQLVGGVSLMGQDDLKVQVLEEAKHSNVRLIVLQFVDILGTMKSVTLPVEHLEEALDEGYPFDGSSIEGFVRIYESDMVAMPDPTTFKILPWRPHDQKEARLICDIQRPGGKPFESCPRQILKQALHDLKQQGYLYNVGPELEFFLLKINGEPLTTPVPHDFGGYFDYSPLDMAVDVRRDATFALQQMGFDIVMSHHEVAPGQHEIDFKFEEALPSADKVITFKTVLKSIALAHGLHATFMPKPFFGQNGSGMHVHQSLFHTATGRNAFFDPQDRYHLSETAYHFIGGQLTYIREIAGFLAPTVNSYKRLTPGYEAPVYICWGRRNRSALIRVPEYFPGREDATRAELRCPDPSCNPYLAFTVMLKAGLEGIRQKIAPPDPVEEDVYEFDDRKLAQFYIKTLPSSLGEAIEAMRGSRLVRDAIGEFAFEKYLAAKETEWDTYRLQVTDWELKQYLHL